MQATAAARSISTLPASKPTFEWTEDQNRALKFLTQPAKHLMLYGGSRSGKTFTIVGALVLRAIKAPGSRHAIFRHRFNHLKTSIGMDTLPKVMALRFPGVPYKIDKTDWVCRIGGSEIWLGGLDDKERTEKILGQEYASLYFNECSQIAFSATLMARTRLAQKTGLVNRAYYDCNPPGSRHWTAMLFVYGKDPASVPAGAPLANPDNFRAMAMNPDGNRQNLAPEYIAELEALPEKQRQRFLLGRFTSELDNALWSLENFRHVPARRPRSDLTEFDRITVAVDPSGASGEEDERSDMIGIVVAGRKKGGRYEVLADRTMRGGPQQWAKVAIDAYHDFEADRIVAEKNYGGAMVEATLKNYDTTVPVKVVTATRGKVVRAEPISALYARGEVDHAQGMGELEDEMVNFTTAGYMGNRSPDRADALVWAMTDLMPTKEPVKFITF
ncbi:MAG: phage terminase large subunit [Beijerinckiaceae bacterium]